MSSPAGGSKRVPMLATPNVDEISDLLAMFNKPSARGPASARGSPSARSPSSRGSPHSSTSASPNKSPNKVSPSKLSPSKPASSPERLERLTRCIAAGLYERSSGTYTSYFLVEPSGGFRIEWHDDYDGSWLRGKGELENVTVTAEEYDDEDGTVPLL